MIGAAKIQSAVGVIPPVVFSVNINPGEASVGSPNGGSTSPVFRSDVIGGVGPFGYEWSIDNPVISINTPDEDNTTFSSGGFNTEESGVITLTVTDTGNGNVEVTGTAYVEFLFGEII